MLLGASLGVPVGVLLCGLADVRPLRVCLAGLAGVRVEAAAGGVALRFSALRRGGVCRLAALGWGFCPWPVCFALRLGVVAVGPEGSPVAVLAPRLEGHRVTPVGGCLGWPGGLLAVVAAGLGWVGGLCFGWGLWGAGVL